MPTGWVDGTPTRRHTRWRICEATASRNVQQSAVDESGAADQKNVDVSRVAKRILGQSMASRCTCKPGAPTSLRFYYTYIHEVNRFLSISVTTILSKHSAHRSDTSTSRHNPTRPTVASTAVAECPHRERMAWDIGALV